ncbi:MAG: Mur ligase family protein [Desulfurobacteriaceae bacterium]
MTLFEEFFRKKEFIWKPGLGRIRKAVEAFGGKNYPSVIVAGTNGKGSTSFMIAEALSKQGFKVGLFSSPHLFRFSERIKVNGEEASEELLNSCFEEILPLVEKEKLTYFESSLLLALSVFRREKVDCAVFEVGLGGRLDATNVLNHQVGVITAVGIDHRNFLGSTVEEIAKEKRGVLKEGMVAVISKNSKKVKEILLKNFKGEAYIHGNDFWEEDIKTSTKGTEFYYLGQLKVKTALIGRHQAVNCSTAIKAAHILCENFLKKKFLIPRKFDSKLPGRFELLKENPPVILDVAHNPDALKTLFKTARGLKIKGDVIYSGLKDKEQEENLRAVAEYLNWSSGKLYLTEIENERAASLEELLKISKKLGLKRIETISHIKVPEILRPTIITGSFYIGEKVERA